MIELKNKQYYFSCEPDEGTFSLRSLNPEFPFFQQARLEAIFHNDY
jgi:hypothetical protein